LAGNELYERVLALRGLEKTKKEEEKEVEKDLTEEELEPPANTALSLDDMLFSVVYNQDRLNIYVYY
jgi:hypothetical protein